MMGQTAGRIVVFYVARCHEDLRWYLSIRSADALQSAANDPGRNVYTLSSAPRARRRLRLVGPVGE